ncbi:GyrI-like domain-containing protein [Weeksella virosa]|uniref:GyrI-like small molecule binding domain-containing protein n=1 Tax=Weeksella virosa (strain ATCC 43766 / DSM 16922 / JCM 21250 / CCUG 30538 / CDC 9751 / IAM 14551 / NBRC 16016 / NCTC 11634 / CL345/78) TaxID=865938 RepID=F0NYK4_WEEVC|nr:GyrI-like domain-containing protein [Weeksella virosa]ADX67124.1 hypothetical protein Weevi_0405 [Weeksella virosa DSM 16922]MDK7676247.1 GyrI-like domain-containing protein [Weeksella virosa]SUP53395.1 Transcriptional regulator, effector-binding domain/component [Weeksella virosa]VEH63139.1 Transcriptional regulator, effector-binding domain/component [Weeksella virosa]
MKQLSLLLAIFIALILVLPIFLPKTEIGEYELELDAPVGLVYEEFNNLQNFSQWEDFMADDEEVKKEISPNPRDINAYLRWQSEKSDIGNGELKIVDNSINEFVLYEVDNSGWTENGTLLVTFEATNNSKTIIKVRYESQKMPYLYRWYNLFQREDNKIEKSLNQLDEYVKTDLKKQRKEGKLIVGEYQIYDMPDKSLIAMKSESNLNEKKILSKIDESFEAIYDVLVNKEEEWHMDLGFPTIYYSTWDTIKKHTTFYSGIPFNENFPMNKKLQKVIIPKGKYLLTLHIGPRSKKAITMTLMRKYAESQQLKLGEKYWEVFLNDPKETDSLLLQSRIYYEIREPKKIK